MDAQREIITAEANVKRTKTDDINNHLSKEDNEMLQMSLGMLRCSLCSDRFKDCVISKCFHLFCKVCLDKILRKERNSKCPSCSEKFTSDDIKQVYFTH
jgi:E3 ubiquitin-protein ligase BRE1